MERFKNAGKAIVSLTLVLAVIVGGALSVSATEAQPLVVAATEAEHSHAGEHPALPMAMGGEISIMTACSICGAPTNVYPDMELPLNMYTHTHGGYYCSATEYWLVSPLKCVAGHVAAYTPIYLRRIEHVRGGYLRSPLSVGAAGGEVSIMTACTVVPGCGAPQNTYPPFESLWSMTAHIHNGIACGIAEYWMVEPFQCVAGHIAVLTPIKFIGVKHIPLQPTM